VGRQPVEDQKKADVAEYSEVFGHVGLLYDEPPGTPSCSSSRLPRT